MMRTSWVFVGLLFAAQASAEDPQWLVEARALEGKPQPAKEFQSVDKWFKARIPAKVVGKVVKEQGSYTVEVDIGSKDSSMFCEVIPEGLDMAGMLRATFEGILSSTNEAGLKVETSALEKVDAGSWGPIPYMKATWVYRIFDGKERLLAGMKQYTFEKDGHGVYCGIIELGYEKTMENVVKAFAETVQFKEAAATPYYSEVNVFTLGDKVIGLAQLYLQRDAEGDILTKMESSLMLAKGDGSATTQEVVRSEWSRPDGSMINAGHVLATDGEITSELTLKFLEDRWVIQGTHSGKTLDNKLDEGTAPVGALKLMMDSRQLLAEADSAGSELSGLLWDTDDPTKLTGAQLKIQEPTGKGLHKVQMKVGATSADGVIEDSTGSVVSAQYHNGGAVISARRVNANGTL